MPTGRSVGNAPLDDIALSIHQELGEVPLDVLGQEPALLGLQEPKQRVLCTKSNTLFSLHHLSAPISQSLTRQR